MGWSSKNQPPPQKGKSCLERRLKRCQTDVQMQGQPLQPRTAPRALRGLKSCSAHYTTPAPIKTSLQKRHHTTPQTQPHHHHKSTTITKTPPTTTTTTTTTSLLWGLSPWPPAYWAGVMPTELNCPCPKGQRGPSSHSELPKKRCGTGKRCRHHTTTKTPPHQTQKHNRPTTKTQPHHHKKTPPHHTTPPHHYKNTTTKTPPQKHHHKNTTKHHHHHHHHHKNTTKHHHHHKAPQKHHHHENTTTPPPQERHQPPQPCQLLSCLERRLKRCQIDVQMQEQPYLYVVKIVGDPPTMTIFAQLHRYGILHTVCDEIFVSYQRTLWFAGGHLIWRAACGTTSKRRPAVKSRLCLETMLQLVGQQLQAPRGCTSSKHAGPHAGLFFLHFQICWAPSWSVQGHHHGRTQTMSGLEDRLSCMWNDVWNDVKTTSRHRDFSTWQ